MDSGKTAGVVLGLCLAAVVCAARPKRDRRPRLSPRREDAVQCDLVDSMEAEAGERALELRSVETRSSVSEGQKSVTSPQRTSSAPRSSFKSAQAPRLPEPEHKAAQEPKYQAKRSSCMGKQERPETESKAESDSSGQGTPCCLAGDAQDAPASLDAPYERKRRSVEGRRLSGAESAPDRKETESEEEEDGVASLGLYKPSSGRHSSFFGRPFGSQRESRPGLRRSSAKMSVIQNMYQVDDVAPDESGFSEPTMNRIAIRIDGLDRYSVFAALVAGFGFNVASAVSHEEFGDVPFVAAGVFGVSTSVATLGSLYATVVFALICMYAKTSLGMENDPGYTAFMKRTIKYREYGFNLFFISLIALGISFITMVFVKFPPGTALPSAIVSAAFLYFIVRHMMALFTAATESVFLTMTDENSAMECLAGYKVSGGSD